MPGEEGEDVPLVRRNHAAMIVTPSDMLAVKAATRSNITRAADRCFISDLSLFATISA
jgi:hypothetical protein